MRETEDNFKRAILPINMIYLLLRCCILMSAALTTYSYSCGNYPANGTSLQFTDPEPNNLIVVDVGKHASLLCCAGNYDTITWYFKGQPYPNWSGISKNKIHNYIGFNQNRQVLEILEVDYTMEGHYNCVISNNEGDSLNFGQELWVKPIQTGSIFLRQEPNCVNKLAKIGDNVTFYCNFFVDRSEICPSIFWTRNDTGIPYYLGNPGFESFFGRFSNFTTFDVETDDCSQGDVITIGTALHIYNVSDDAFGVYHLTLIREITVMAKLNLTKINEAPPEISPSVLEQRSTVAGIVLGSTLVCLFILMLGYMYFETDMKLFYKRRKHRKGTLDDQKTFDVFISYSSSEEDREFVMNNLRKFLVGLSYNVCIEDINFLPGGDRATSSVKAVNLSRCCILVLSPDYLKQQYCSIEFNQALEKHRIKKNIIPIMFRPISPESLTRQEALQHLIKAGETLKWQSDSSNKSFWKKLEVRMPLRPNPHHSVNSNHIDRSTSTNSQAPLCPMRSVSKDSAISCSFFVENICQTNEQLQQTYTFNAV